MARRKPSNVERNRQQQRRQREIERQQRESADAVDESASNEPSHVVVIHDSDEDQADQDVGVLSPPTPKRPRTMFMPRGWFDDVTSYDVDLCVGAPSQLSLENEPWGDDRRSDALEVSFPLDPIGCLAQKLETLEANGTFVGLHAQSQFIGIRAMPSGVRGSSSKRESTRSIQLRDFPLWESIGYLLSPLVECDMVTIELQRVETAVFEWRVGIDWHRQHPNIGDFMVWLLHQSKSHNNGQWWYAYPKEIDALFQMKMGPWRANPETTAFDIHDVYAKIDVQRQLQRDVSNIPAHVTTAGSALLPTLRDYQKAALSWMLAREGVGIEQRDESGAMDTGDRLSWWIHFPAPNDSMRGELLYHLFSGSFQLVGDDSQDSHVTNINAVRGGILADEMGLGKTVEVIALVLSNPSPLAVPTIVTEVITPENTVSKSSMERNCICGSEKDCDPGWVQCDLCNLWHHRLCTGFDPDGPMHYSFGESAVLSEDSFACFHCQVEQHLMLSCKTTLIVSPESIHDQWESEIKRHVKPGALKLLRYPGVKALRSRLQGRGPSAEWSLLASLGAEMASYDIVLTTYEALGSDLHHIPTSMGRERRSSTRQIRKRYAFIASPLVFLNFWRVCMDEAQVGVENTQLQAALTVAEIRTEMQWIVTGTPFSTQLMDLYGCFKFLRLAPYCDEANGKQWFQNQIGSLFTNGAVERVFDLLLWNSHDSSSGGGLLWRTNKRDVFSQLGLPSQSEEIVWCRLSNVERLFYDKQEVEVANALKKEEEARRREQGDDYDENEEVGESVWHRLLLLRQVCCHPQVGQILRSIGATNRFDRHRGARNKAAVDGTAGGQATMSVLTMDDFLMQLFEKCRRECEEAQRKLIAAHNGHASLALISDDFATAIVKYVMSVQLIRSNWEDFRADLLPRLHILDNLANSVRRVFNLHARMEDQVVQADDVNDEQGVVMVDDEHGDQQIITSDGSPKQTSLMPDLPVLLRTITQNGIVVEGADVEAITKECEALGVAADKIRRFYLLEGELKHSSALHHFESVRDTTETKLYRPAARTRRRVDEDLEDPMLCSSSGWWLEMFEVLQKLPDGQIHVAHMVDRMRAHLYALGTTWSTSFVERFHDIHGLMLALVNELVVLNKKRGKIFQKLIAQSQQKPSKMDVEISGNCKKCRDARDGPVCWHCKFYKEMEGYKQHMLGIDSTVAPATGLASWTADLIIDDDDDESQQDRDGALRATDSTTASTSLILDVFRQLSSGARLLLRENRSAFSAAELQRLTKLLQEGVQQETELWAQLLREWNRGKKLFHSQHQRLGALDELEMAQMKIRLRLPGEVIVSATDKLYKLEPYELPTKLVSLDVERAVAETELKQKQSDLRYLKHLKAKTDRDRRGNGESVAADDKTCTVCLEDFGSHIAMLPCAHKTCVKCSDKLASRLRSSRSIRCPTCRRIFPIDVRKEIENDIARAKDGALAARTASIQTVIPDHNVALLRSGFSSKIDTILRRVRALATKNPELKALVFTQWHDMMGVIAAALRLNGIKCFTFTTKKQFHRVLQEFKRFPDACVLALPFKIGANGLNIIEATEVLLVEPLLNTSIEAQAINRVHRIGQTKQTRVHRFVVDNSVEERIHWLGRSKRPRSSRDEESKHESNDRDEQDMQGDDSVVVGRQEKEKVTLGQLHAMLSGRSAVHVNQDDEELMDGDIVVQDGEHPFWLQRVELNGRVTSRREAREILERRRAAEKRTTANADLPEPVTLLVDRDVGLPIAHELLQLKIQTETDGQTAEVLREHVGMAQHRIGEEMRIWRASQAEANW